MTRKTATDSKVWAGKTEASRATGTPVRTIQNWIDRSIIVPNDKGEVDCLAVLRQDRDRYKEAADRQVEKESNPQQELLKAQTRKITAEAELKELELARAKGQVIDFEEALADFQTALLTTRAKFLALPARVSMQLAGISEPKKINQLLTDTIDECLAALSVEFLNSEDD